MSARVFPFPTLAPESLDYIEGNEFGANIFRDSNAQTISVRYVLRGKNLITDLLHEGGAKFACVLCAPETMYREIQSYDGNPIESDEQVLTAEQQAKFDDSLISSPPMFRPIIVAARKIERTIKDSDGLDEVFLGKCIKFPEGTIMAADYWQRLGGGKSGLLVIVPDKSIVGGAIEVDADPSAGYCFRVKVHPDFNQQLRLMGAEQRSHRNSILTHALSAGMTILKDEYGPKETNGDGDQWRQYPNLRFLSGELKNKGYFDWTDEGFSPEYAATLLRPHIIGEDKENDD